MKLHHSQTILCLIEFKEAVLYPYEITLLSNYMMMQRGVFGMFYIPMKSHYSQTSIWQYTHYKRVVISYNILSKKKLSSAFRPRPVRHALPTCDSNIFFYILFDLLYPVEFTCLSNWLNINYMHVNLLYPVEFTYLSNLRSLLGLFNDFYSL